MNIIDIDLLTPGSVWHRPDGHSSRVLHITNKALPKKMKEKFPEQVVFLDEDDNILSQDVEMFLAKRKFYNVDPDLESRLDDLTATGTFSGHGKDEDTLDLNDDDLLVVDDTNDQGQDGDFEPVDEEDADQQALDALTIKQEKGAEAAEVDFGADETNVDLGRPIAKFIAQNPELPAVIDAEELAQAVSSYQQTPNMYDMSTQHVLFIRAEPGVNMKSLYAAFSPKHAQINQVFTFEVEQENEVIAIDWDMFVGIYPAIFYGSSMYQVIFQTNAVAEDETVMEDAVEHVEAEMVETEMPATSVPVQSTAPAAQIVQPSLAAPVVPVQQAAQTVIIQNQASPSVQVTAG